jgi:ureidoacrylate peracid hydrolase
VLAKTKIVRRQWRWNGRSGTPFADTNLHALLSARGMESRGTTTVCVESTLRDAVFYDYKPIVLIDCTADMSDALHESALARIDMFFGRVWSSKELVAALENERAPARAAR